MTPKLKLVALKWEPVIIELIWKAYSKGAFNFYPGLSKEGFLQELVATMQQYSAFWLVLSSEEPIAWGFSRLREGILEPHVEFFPNQTIYTKLKVYKMYFQAVQKDPNLIACLVRSYKRHKKVFDYFVRRGILRPLTFPRPQRSTMPGKKEYQYVLIKQQERSC